MMRRILAAVLTFSVMAGAGRSAVAQGTAKRAAMWEAYQSSRPIADRDWLPAVFGYELAAQAEVKVANKANIANERKAAKHGGVVDLEALYQYQQRIREADEESARIRGLAKSMGVRPAKSSSASVDTVAKCVQSGSDSTLRDERVFSAEDAEAGSCFWLYLLHCEISGDGESVRGWMSQAFGRS
jgi:TolA-binding protein